VPTFWHSFGPLAKYFERCAPGEIGLLISPLTISPLKESLAFPYRMFC
jgi:hypothetical protein